MPFPQTPYQKMPKTRQRESYIAARKAVGHRAELTCATFRALTQLAGPLHSARTAGFHIMTPHAVSTCLLSRPRASVAAGLYKGQKRQVPSKTHATRAAASRQRAPHQHTSKQGGVIHRKNREMAKEPPCRPSFQLMSWGLSLIDTSVVGASVRRWTGPCGCAMSTPHS